MKIAGKVVRSEHVYKRKTYLLPVEHHYEDAGEEPYIKYGCPVCEALGNKHQVARGEPNCPLCNVNLIWEGSEAENEEELAAAASDDRELTDDEVDCFNSYIEHGDIRSAF